ncbi:MAG: ribulose-phosphate 3-epimerase, partial [Actinobacteria bacterium]|nr:ribulose-phosphate 3-epimerase [Actinomycetota bacterium]
AGLALKPGTALDDYVDLLPHLDMILIMTVEPGFGGQSFMADQMSKVRKARELITAGDLDVWVQVDGGVSAATIQECADAGADTFVAGSAVYQSADPAKVVSTLRELADAATSTSWWCAH